MAAEDEGDAFAGEIGGDVTLKGEEPAETGSTRRAHRDGGVGVAEPMGGAKVVVGGDEREAAGGEHAVDDRQPVIGDVVENAGGVRRRFGGPGRHIAIRVGGEPGEHRSPGLGWHPTERFGGGRPLGVGGWGTIAEFRSQSVPGDDEWMVALGLHGVDHRHGCVVEFTLQATDDR